jgi:phosphatidylglycerophosphate synthase
MLDSALRGYIDPPLNSVARMIAKTPVTGIHITWAGFLFGVIACLFLSLQFGLVALGFLILNRLCDGLDGAVARACGEVSSYGGYLDITLDFFIYAGIPFFAAIGLMSETAFLAVAFLLFSFIGSGISFLGYAIMAEKHAMDDKAHQGKKSFYFARGFMEGTETIIFMVLVCLLPQYFEILCYVFGTLCWVTTAARIHMAGRVFG